MVYFVKFIMFEFSSMQHVVTRTWLGDPPPHTGSNPVDGAPDHVIMQCNANVRT